MPSKVTKVDQGHMPTLLNSEYNLDMNDELLVDFKAEEVWRALEQMHASHKIPGSGRFGVFKKKN